MIGITRQSSPISLSLQIGRTGRTGTGARGKGKSCDLFATLKVNQAGPRGVSPYTLPLGPSFCHVNRWVGPLYFMNIGLRAARSRLSARVTERVICQRIFMGGRTRNERRAAPRSKEMRDDWRVMPIKPAYSDLVEAVACRVTHVPLGNMGAR